MVFAVRWEVPGLLLALLIFGAAMLQLFVWIRRLIVSVGMAVLRLFATSLRWIGGDGSAGPALLPMISGTGLAFSLAVNSIPSLEVRFWLGKRADVLRCTAFVGIAATLSVRWAILISQGGVFIEQHVR